MAPNHIVFIVDDDRGIREALTELLSASICMRSDIPASVRAIKAGAVDFLPNPFMDQT